LGILAAKWKSKTNKTFENEIFIENSC